MTNKGIVVSGGSFTAHQVAVGDGATITNATSADLATLLEAIEALRHAIAASPLEAGPKAEMTTAASTLAHESKASTPDRGRFEQALHYVEKSASAIPAITAAVAAIQVLLPRLFGA